MSYILFLLIQVFSSIVHLSPNSIAIHRVNSYASKAGLNIHILFDSFIPLRHLHFKEFDFIKESNDIENQMTLKDGR